MAAFLQSFLTFFADLITGMGMVVSFINDNPIIQIGVMIAIGAIVVRLTRKFIPGI